ATVGPRLEALLTEQGERWQVVNGGVPGYNVEAAAGLLAVVGDQVSPTDVVLGMHLNDYDALARLNDIGVPSRGGDASLLDRSEFALLLRWLWRWSQGALFQQRAIREVGGDGLDLQTLDRAVVELHRQFYAAPRPDGWARITRGLALLRDEAARRGIN